MAAGRLHAFSMQNVKSLRVYQAAEELAERVYRLAKLLPQEEKYALGQQLRRSVVSVGSNIAEGCGRGGNAELTRFLRIALGSATELEFQLSIAIRLELLGSTQAHPAVEACVAVQRMLTKLIIAVRPAPETSRGRPTTENREPTNDLTPGTTPAPSPGSHVAAATAPSP